MSATSLAAYVRILGRGPGRARSLTDLEATEAMALMLSADASPESIGALLMLLRMKGETPAEIAGFARAAQDTIAPLHGVDLDWPSYAAGRSRGAPLFLLSARLVAQAGYRVLLHGWNGADTKVRAGLAAAGIVRAATVQEAEARLQPGQPVYVPLEVLEPELLRLLQLRDVLGLRSCINTVCRMLNPGRAQASVQGVFHPSYRLLQRDAAQLLGWRGLSVIKGGGGEFERHPAKTTTAIGLQEGAPFEGDFDPVVAGQIRLADGPHSETSLEGLWSGHQDDPFATAVVCGTAALALHSLGHAAPDALARRLWNNRLIRKETAA